jgi:hypothetical protein
MLSLVFLGALSIIFPSGISWVVDLWAPAWIIFADFLYLFEFIATREGRDSQGPVTDGYIEFSQFTAKHQKKALLASLFGLLVIDLWALVLWFPLWWNGALVPIAKPRSDFDEWDPQRWGHVRLND